MQPPGTFFGPPLRALLGGSWRGQGHGIQLRGGATGGLAQTGWMKPEKNTGHSPEGCTNPLLPLPWSSAHPAP